MADSDAKWTVLCLCDCSYSTSGCTFVRDRVCTFLYISLSGLSSTPNGLMGTLWCLSNPLVWDTLRVRRSTKAQPCLWRRVSLWWGATAVLTVAGLMVIILPRGSTLWTLKTRTSPLHTPLLCLNRGPKHTSVDHGILAVISPIRLSILDAWRCWDLFLLLTQTHPVSECEHD